MQNFVYDIPTKIYFGKDQIEQLPMLVKAYGKRVLLVYGGGSIKKIGLYDKVIDLLNQNEIIYAELSGVEPNPRLSTVKKGVQICLENDIDLILPVGGGSTIDCAKAIAGGVKYGGDPWDFYKDRSILKEALPIITVLTLSATGSEMDPLAVISNEETNDKKGTGHPCLYPKASICDPTYTFSVSKFQTASGTADIFAHILETYFRKAPGAFMQQRMCESLMKTCCEYGKVAVDEPENYDARANLMWASSWAINGFLKCGFAGPWVLHPIEHQISAYYDIAHGAGLAILIPHWFEKIASQPDAEELFFYYGVNVFDLDPKLSGEKMTKQAIERTRLFFKDMGLPMTLREMGIEDKSKFEVMAEKSLGDGAGKTFFPLTKEDIMSILEAAF